VLEDLLDLSSADVTSKRQERIRAADARVSALRERIETIRAAEDVEKLASPLDGNELMALFGGSPGPWIKQVKDRLLAAVLDGELAPDDKAGAERIARDVVGAGNQGSPRLAL
jgi:poly(A) polymerase